MRTVKRVAMLGHKRIPSREGGVEIVVAELATRMVRRGISVTCYNRRGHHVGGSAFDAPVEKEYCGIDLRTVPTVNAKGLAAVSSSFFASLKAAFGHYDVVHVHAEGPAAFCWLPKLCGKRVVLTVHGLDWAREKWKSGFGSRYIRMGERAGVRFADEIIVLSENVRRYFETTYGRQTHFIPNGISRPERQTPDEIKERFALAGDDYILFLGRLVPEKGLRYLVEAFRAVKTDKKLVIAGSASDSDDFEQELHAAAADDPRILFTGFVQGRLLEELYSNAYLYVLPSDLEGMPLSLLEAMSYGNCCVVSDIDECASVVGDQAILFRKGDADHLREQLQRLCDDPETVHRYRENAADYICRKYDWDTVTERTVALYENKNESDAVS